MLNKLSIAFGLFLALVGPVSGQTSGHRIAQVITKTPNKTDAQIVPYARVSICTDNAACSGVPVFQDANLTVPFPQPLTADADGNYSYYVAPGCYKEQILTPGTPIRFIHGVCVSSPSSGSGTVASVGITPANGFTGSVANPNTTPIITMDVAAGRYLPTSTDATTWNSKQNALGFTPQNIASKGTANGYASLDSTALIPPVQLPVFGSAAAGVAPASGGGTTTFLRADGTWAAPPGGASNPGGTLNELNANLNNTGFQGSGFFTNTAHSLLAVPSAQFAVAQVNAPPNSLCGGRGCGIISNYFQNTANNDGNGNLTGFAQAYFNYRNSLYTQQGIFNGFSNNPNEASGGAVTKFQNDNTVFQSSAITQNHGSMVFCSKPYDCASFYTYVFNHGGLRTGGDEGITAIRAGGGNDFRRQGQGPISGNPATGATTVTLTSLTNAADFFVGGYVIDQTDGPSTTGNITAYNSTTNIVTVTPGSVTQAAANGTTQQTIVIPGIPTVAGTTLSITTHFDNGTDTRFRDGIIVFGCGEPDIEFVNATTTAPDGSGNQVITGTFFHGHATACKVAQGGTMGILDLIADRLGASWKTSYFVFGAPDDSHLLVRSYITGGLGPINASKHNFGYSTTNPTITRTSNVATVCGLGSNPYLFGGQYILVSGASDTSFNGNFTASILNASRCITYANSGPDVSSGVTGATMATGGTVNSPDGLTPGTGGFAVWPTAELRQMGTTSTTTNGITTQAYNNQLILYPNSMTFSSGDLLVVLDDMQNKTEPLAAYGAYDTAPSKNLNKWMNSRFVGQGVATSQFYGFDIQNDNNYNLYKGGGAAGQLDGAIAMNIEGPFAWGIRMTAPLPNGRAIEILQNPMINAASGNNTFEVLDAVGPSGNPGFGIDYNPATGISNIQSGTGNGIQSVITMTPTDINMNTSTGMTFTSPSYRFSNLAGSGTRFVQAGPTGILTTTAAVGSVTSVGLTVPTWASVTGSPVTTSGNITLNLPVFGASGSPHAPGIVPDPTGIVGTTKFLREDATWVVPTLTFANQNANLVFAGPTTGSAAAPAFRSLVAADLPLATTGAFGAVKPDGTTVTISAGVISAVGGGTGCTLPGVSGALLFDDGAGHCTGTANATLDSSGNITAKSFSVSTSSGVGGGVSWTEGTAPSGASGQDILHADSTTHTLLMNNNNIGDQIVMGSTTYTALTDASPIVWATSGVRLPNATVTLNHLTSTRALNVTGLLNGTSGVLIIKQDSTGGAALTGGTGCTWKQAGGGGATFAVTTAANAIDILTFSYDGTNCYVSMQKNFN